MEHKYHGNTSPVVPEAPCLCALSLPGKRLISSIQIVFPQKQVPAFLCFMHLPSREELVGS